MRICFEAIALFLASIAAVLTGLLGFAISDDWLDWVLKKITNMCYIVFGPVLFTLSVYGFIHVRSISHVCGVHGIKEGQFNYFSVFILVSSLFSSIYITYSMLLAKTTDMASSAFQDENSILFHIVAFYYSYSERLRRQRERENRI